MHRQACFLDVVLVLGCFDGEFLKKGGFLKKYLSKAQSPADISWMSYIHGDPKLFIRAGGGGGSVGGSFTRLFKKFKFKFSLFLN